MHRRIFWLLVGAAVAAMSLSATGAAAVQSQSGPSLDAPSTAERVRPRRGGTVIFGQDQEPRVLNGWITEGNLFATTEVVVPVMDSGMRYNHKAQLVPLLFAGQPKIIKRKPFTVRFRYKKRARWNDGRPITGADWVFTWRTVMNPRWSITSRTGWEDIRRVRARGKTVTVTFKRPYAAWKPLVGSGPLPRHALRGENFDQVWRNNLRNPKTGRPIASGPYIFSRWVRGQLIQLVRNPRYWRRNAFLNSIIYRPIPDTNTQFQALRAGEVHMTRPQPQLQIAQIRRDRRFRVQSGPEFAWEHIDFQQGRQGHPALKKRFVRQAIIAGINRQQIAGALFRQISPNLPILQNVVFKPFEPAYRPNWQVHKFNQRRAINILRANRCRGGPVRPGAGRGVYSCPGVGRLSFRFTSTAGNQLRELAFEIMQRQLRSIGVELRSTFGPAAHVFGTVLPSGDWDMFMFTWVGSPTSPITQENLHACGGDQNYMGYCNRALTRLLRAVKRTVNDRQRIRMLNRADAIMSQDVPTVPLFARPGFLIHQVRVRGVLRNPTQASAFWNSGNWWLAR